jgi:hypothetical protein
MTGSMISAERLSPATCPSNDVPAPNAMIGARCSAATRTTAAASSELPS